MPLKTLLNGKRFPVNNVDIWNHQNKHAPNPKGSRPYFDRSAPHIGYVAYATQATISSVKQSKTNVMPCLHQMQATR